MAIMPAIVKFIKAENAIDNVTDTEKKNKIFQSSGLFVFAIKSRMPVPISIDIII